MVLEVCFSTDFLTSVSDILDNTPPISTKNVVLELGIYDYELKSYVLSSNSLI